MPERLPPEFITTTANSLEGFRITRTLGVVRGITVRSRSVIGNIGVKFQQFFGGNISLLQEMCEQARADAFAIAIEHARSLGANAMVAIRYDATELMAGVSEVLCYGTAVRVIEEKGVSS